MGERPIIYIALGGETEDDFVRAAAKQFRGDVFIAMDPPPPREIRVEARFGNTSIGVRGDAIATPTTRNNAKGVLVRMVKLEPDSVAVPIWDPAAPPTPSPMSATLAKGAPQGLTIARTQTPAKHVVAKPRPPAQQRPPTSPVAPVEEVAEEFSAGAAITNTSSLSADIAKTLHDTVTPARGVPEPKAHAKLVRRTPVAGVPPVPPKPVIKSIPVPPEPTIDDEWAFDAPTARPTPIPKELSRKPAPTPPATTPAKPVRKTAPTPPSAIPSIGARAPETPPRGAPTFSAPRPAAPAALDDDAALDSAFDALDDDGDDLMIPVEKPIVVPAPPKLPSIRPTPPSLPTVRADGKPGTPVPPAKSSSAAAGLGAPSPRAASEPQPSSGPRTAAPAGESKVAAATPAAPAKVAAARVASEPEVATPPASVFSAPARAASEPKPTTPAEPRTGEPKSTTAPAKAAVSRAASEPTPTTPASVASAPVRAASEPKATTPAEPRTSVPGPTPPVVARAASEPRPATPASVASAPVHAASEPKPATPAVESRTPSEPEAMSTGEPMLSTAGVSGTHDEAKPAPPASNFTASGGPEHTSPTSRTGRDALQQAAAATPAADTSDARAVGASELGRIDSLGVARASTDATAVPRSRRWIVPAAIAGVVAVVLVVIIATRGGSSPTPAAGSGGSATARNAELDKHLAMAAARIQDGKLVGPDGDTALDHLLNAKRLAPTDKRVLDQLNLLANTFEKLGDGAIAAGDLGEAATHFQAALTAEPDRKSAATKLEDVEDRARGKK